MNLDNFKKHTDWVKVWSGKQSVNSCSQFGGEYTEDNTLSNDSAFGLSVYVSHKGISDCWVSEGKKKYLGRRLIAQVQSDEKTIKKIADNLKSHARKVFSFIKKNSDKEAGLELYNGFWKEMSDYYLWHLNCKYIVDYFSLEELRKYLPALEEARLYAEPVFREQENFMEKIAEKVATIVDLPKDLILSTTKEELRAYFSGEKLPPIKELEKRFSKAIQFFELGKSKLFAGAEVAEMEKIVLPKAGQILKGQTAYKGKAKGQVRIVWKPADPSIIFEKGDILVTGMTRPEFLPLMKKAGAFVTDAGGILSHAAIVAREIGKPCIIGTKIATKVLKDGDLVEVDANKGIVKIIKKA